MKILKKLMITVLNILLIDLLIIFIISLNLKQIINNVVTESIIMPAIEDKLEKVFTNNIEELSEDDINSIREVIEENEEIKNISNQYINVTIEYLSENNNLSNLNLKDDLSDILIKNKELIEEKTGKEISDYEIENIITDIDDRINLNKIYKEQVYKIKNKMTDEQLSVIKIYNVITNKTTKIIILLSSLIILLLIALIKKTFYRWIINFAISLIISGMFVMIFSGLFKYLVSYGIKQTGITINVKEMFNTSLITLILGLLLIIIYNIILKIKRK